MVSSYRTWHTCRYEQFTKRQGNLESRMHRNGARPVRRGEVDAVPGKSETPTRNAWPPTLPINPDAHQPSPLVATLLVCRFCRQVTKKGDPLPGFEDPWAKETAVAEHSLPCSCCRLSRSP